MLCNLDPRKNALIALRHALLVFATSPGLLMPLAGLTTWAFMLMSESRPACYMRRCGVELLEVWKGEAGAEAASPVLLGRMMFHKWGTDWGSWIGPSGEDEKAVSA